MPTSRANHIFYLIDQVMHLRPKSILDIGVGFGTKGMLFREYTDIWAGNYQPDSWKVQIDGIEVFADYVTDLQRQIYDTIYIGDALEVLDTLGEYDMIYAGDVLEHFSREDGLKMLELMKKHAKHVIIATPAKVSQQGAVFNNEHETHRSQWTPEDLAGASIKYFGNTMVARFCTEKQVYYCAAMSFYGDKVPMKGYNDSLAPTVFIGLYFDSDYASFKRHLGSKTVFWNGSDVTRLLANPNWVKVVQEEEATHFCHNEQLRAELATIGVKAEVAPLFFGYKKNYQQSYKHSKRPQVFLCAHPGREHEYGVYIVEELAAELPDIDFHVYGIEMQSRANLIFHGLVPEAQMDEEIRGYQCCLRMNAHDGMSQIVCKSKLLGLYPIISRDKEEIRRELLEMKNRDKPWHGDVAQVKDLSWIPNMIAM